MSVLPQWRTIGSRPLLSLSAVARSESFFRLRVISARARVVRTIASPRNKVVAKEIRHSRSWGENVSPRFEHLISETVQGGLARKIVSSSSSSLERRKWYYYKYVHG